MAYMCTIEVAKALGITRASLYLWIKQKKIPFEKVSRKEIRFQATDVEKIFQERSKKKSNRLNKRKKWSAVPENSYSAEDVRKILGVTRTRIWQLHELGDLKFDKNFYPAIISKEGLEDYLIKRKSGNSGYIGVCEAMKKYNISHKVITGYIKSGVLKSIPYRSGSKRLLIFEESFENIPQTTKYARGSYVFKAIPEGYISATEAAKKLNTNVQTIWKLAKSGRLQSFIRDTKNNRIFIKEPCVLQDLVTIDQASHMLKKSGKVIMQLIESNSIESVVNESNDILIPAKALEGRSKRRFRARA